MAVKLLVGGFHQVVFVSVYISQFHSLTLSVVHVPFERLKYGRPRGLQQRGHHWFSGTFVELIPQRERTRVSTR